MAADGGVYRRALPGAFEYRVNPKPSRTIAEYWHVVHLFEYRVNPKPSRTDARELADNPCTTGSKEHTMKYFLSEDHLCVVRAE
jgi:hypothetical protein